MNEHQQLQVQLEKQAEDIRELKLQLAQLQAANPLWGKKYVACGDSFTEGDVTGLQDENGLSNKESPVFYDSEWKMYKTYPWRIGKRNHMTVINEARCGSTIALTKEYLAGEDGIAIDYRRPFSYQRYLSIPEDTDYCTIWFGINDAAHTNLGTIEDATNETYYGAWNVVLKWLITNRPYMKLGIIITNRGDAKWREATRQCARKWGVPYLDMMGDDKVPLILEREPELGVCEEAEKLRRKAFWVSEENHHPNFQAHEYQSYFIEEFLRRL